MLPTFVEDGFNNSLIEMLNTLYQVKHTSSKQKVTVSNIEYNDSSFTSFWKAQHENRKRGLFPENVNAYLIRPEGQASML